MSEEQVLGTVEPPNALAGPNGPTSIMQVISRAAADPNTDVEKLERLMTMYERIEGKKAETVFNAAMTQAQQEMGRVSADAVNPQTRSKYASYAALDRALRPIYTRHGFALSFGTGEGIESHVMVLCHVSHTQGHSRDYRVLMPADGVGAKGGAVMTRTHAAGAAMSYGMRYLLKLIFNVAVGEDDDDGNSASGIQRITEDQIANLDALITETRADKSLFLKYMQATSLDRIQACAYNRAVSALEARRKKSMEQPS